jgi:hypothetical protein
MMMNKNVNPHIEDHATELTVNITELLISKHVPPNDLAQYLSRRNSDASDVWELIDQLVNLILRENGQFVSRETILQKIIYEDVLSAIYTSDSASIPKYQQLFQQTIRKLLTYEVYSTITIPIIDLEVGQNPFWFGKVLLLPVTEEFKESDIWKDVDSYFEGRTRGRFLSVAQIVVPGDNLISVQQSQEIVSGTLVLLRGIGFQVGFREDYEVSQFGLLNEYPIWRNRFVYRDNLKENFRIDPSRGEFTLIGKRCRPCNLHEDILRNIDTNLLSRLEEILLTGGENEMQRKLLRGFHWIGEATKPDKFDSKAVKLVFGLEAMIRGRSGRLRDSLAERAAFLVGCDAVERLLISEEIKKVYDLRSDIVHGQIIDLAKINLEADSKLIRRVAWAVLQNIDQFENIKQLKEWVKKKSN